MLSYAYLSTTSILTSISFLFFIIVCSSSFSTSSSSLFHSSFATKNDVNSTNTDIFGITKIYPTKPGGKEWFLNMSNPENDPHVSFTFNPDLIKQNDSSWKINKDKVRINVDTLNTSKEWKNVEITGYVKVDSLIDPSTNVISDIDWVSRTDKHNENYPCYGVSLHGGIYPDGSIGWKKEIWFTGGYTKDISAQKITDSLLGRWIGWKTVVYNIDNDSSVRMESYLDNSNSNHWIKVFEITDDGGWFASSSDKIFYSANCGRSKDYRVLNSGPIVTFRADNMILDFKNLSIREIIPPI